MTTILAVDPGETTGWCLAEVHSGKPLEVLSVGQLNGAELLQEGMDLLYPDSQFAQERAVALALMQIVSEHQVEVLVVEDFVLRQFTTMDRAGIGPAQIAAMLEVWVYEIIASAEAHEAGVGAEVQMVLQDVASAKRVVTDERLKALGLWVRGLQHARDAIRHAELYRRRVSVG